MKIKEALTTFFSSLSLSTLILNFEKAIDIAWKIVGVLSGIIAIICFITSSINKIKIKIEKAKLDGVITKDEKKDILNDVIEDTEKVIDFGKSVYEDIKNIKDDKGE